jgi:hypothetical protein
VKFRSNGLAVLTIFVGAWSVAACGSDRTSVSTAPTSVPAAITVAHAPSAFIAPLDHGSRQHVEGEGIITGLKDATSCPTLTFFIGSKSIDVTTDTVIEGGTCADLTIGKRVHVVGEMLGDDVAASQIQIQSDSPGHPVVEGNGRVTRIVSSSCPSLVFMAEDVWTVTLTASTTFVNGTCADIAVGKKVGVKGTVTGDHEVLATQIVFKNDDES